RVGGVVQFEVHHRGLILAAGQVLQGTQGQEFPPAFAALDNAAYAERVIEDLDRVPDPGMLGLGKQVVNNYIIRALKRTALQIVEAARHALVTRQIDSGDDLQRSRG